MMVKYWGHFSMNSTPYGITVVDIAASVAVAPKAFVDDFARGTCFSTKMLIKPSSIPRNNRTEQKSHKLLLPNKPSIVQASWGHSKTRE
jgi:hypothetical protein